MTLTTPKRVASLILASAVFAAACGSGSATPAPSTPASSATPGASQPAGSDAPSAPAIEGEVIVSGSSTVEPISSGVAQMLKDANPGFDATVEGPGTGDGFKKFCAGETDISDASRQIKDEEKALCDAANIEFVELKIAIDGLSILTSVNNTAVECLSYADLYALIGPESTGFGKWSDAQAIATDLGSNTALPDAELKVNGPGEESGTFDSFVELVIAKTAEARNRKGETTRPDYTANANDNALIEGISGSDTSLGWVGFAFAQQNLDKVRLINVSKDANGTCVEPTPETIASGEYPLARSLYIYVNKAKAAANPAIGAYVDYYLAEGTIAKVLETVPYVNLTDEALAETRSTWEASK